MMKKYQYFDFPYFLNSPTQMRSGTQITVVQEFDNSPDATGHVEGYFVKGDHRLQALKNKNAIVWLYEVRGGKWRCVWG